MPSSFTKRLGLQFMVGAVALIAAGCLGRCNEGEPSTITLSPTPTAATKAATTAVTSTPTRAATTTSTTAPSTPTAAVTPVPTAAPYSGRMALGYDHPPFEQDYRLSGNSVAIACGTLQGVPPGSVIVINLGGGAGQPASVTGNVGADGTFSTPFPIMQFGPLTATLGSVRTPGGATLPGTPPTANATVAGGADVACKP